MRAIFSEKGQKNVKNGQKWKKYLEIWAKIYKISVILKRGSWLDAITLDFFYKQLVYKQLYSIL